MLSVYGRYMANAWGPGVVPALPIPGQILELWQSWPILSFNEGLQITGNISIIRMDNVWAHFERLDALFTMIPTNTLITQSRFVSRPGKTTALRVPQPATLMIIQKMWV